jgi:hypothetical protein
MLFFTTFIAILLKTQKTARFFKFRPTLIPLGYGNEMKIIVLQLLKSNKKTTGLRIFSSIYSNFTF